jgi:hypothetical protein
MKPVLKIRTGQRKPFKKGTYEQVQERIEFVIALMRPNPTISRWAIQKAVKKKFDIEFRQCAEYITQAKKLIDKASDLSQIEARSLIVTALVHQISLGRNVVSACNTLAEIKGLFPPRRVEQSGPDGGPIEIKDGRPLKDLPDEQLRKVVESFSNGMPLI